MTYSWKTSTVYSLDYTVKSGGLKMADEEWGQLLNRKTWENLFQRRISNFTFKIMRNENVDFGGINDSLRMRQVTVEPTGEYVLTFRVYFLLH
jgi:hypothetical protein